jgi:serine/threonine-protein kinase
VPSDSGEREARTTTGGIGASALLRGLVTRLSRPSAAQKARSAIPSPGEIIAGKYAVEEVLGRGGMGVVVAARHMQLGQRVAIKFLRGDAAADGSAVARFLQEGRAAAALSNEHVTKVHDVGTLETGEPYLLMEFLSGADLGRRLRENGPMPIEEAVGAVEQACEGISEAHARGIIHRDLKPSNLFMTKRLDGTPLVKVLDFGISKVTERTSDAPEQSLTGSGVAMGSTPYMSPEQVRSSKDVDARSDIWSLGVILYELLTGTSPFLASTTTATLAKILSERPAPIRAARPEVPVALEAVILDCFERDVMNRPQTIGQLASRLLPFAPREAALSVERILRVERAFSPAGPNLATQPIHADVAGAAENAETLLSIGHTTPTRRAKPMLAAVAFVVLAIVLSTAAIVTRTHQRASGPSPASSGPAISASRLAVAASASSEEVGLASLPIPTVMDAAPSASASPSHVSEIPPNTRTSPGGHARTAKPSPAARPTLKDDQIY